MVTGCTSWLTIPSCLARVRPHTAWTLTLNWLTEEGFGVKGYLSLYYYSGEGHNIKGCAPDMKLRLALTLMTLADPPQYLLMQHFPKAVGLPNKERDAFFRRYLLDSLTKEGIAWRYT